MMQICWEDVENTETPGEFIVQGYLVEVHWLQIKIWRNEPDAVFDIAWCPETVKQTAHFSLTTRVD
ncbi:MAG: hypothetical protein ACRECW_12040 [Phyllobacterium sp.]